MTGTSHEILLPPELAHPLAGGVIIKVIVLGVFDETVLNPDGECETYVPTVTAVVGFDIEPC